MGSPDRKDLYREDLKKEVVENIRDVLEKAGRLQENLRNRREASEKAKESTNKLKELIESYEQERGRQK